MVLMYSQRENKIVEIDDRGKATRKAFEWEDKDKVHYFNSKHEAIDLLKKSGYTITNVIYT